MKRRIIISILVLLMLFVTPVINTQALTMEESKIDKINRTHPLDSGKEILFYLLYTENDDKLINDVRNMKSDLKLSEEQFIALKEIGLNEHLKDNELNEKSKIDTYKNNIESVNLYNNNIYKLTDQRNQELIRVFKSTEELEKFRDWIYNWWIKECDYRMNRNSIRADIDRVSNIWATQYYPNKSGSIEASLPDKKLKFANLGWPNGYSNPPYTVNVYNPKNSKSVKNVEILDVGPWNEDDNYWDTDRRMFSGLDLGVPEAQAAFFDRYNNGKNQFGRVVSNPAGIDLSIELARDLGFGKNVSGYIDVRYEYLP